MSDKLFICPVCADFFDTSGTYHCLNCNHHYPAESDGTCHNCRLSLKGNGYRVIKSSITGDDLGKLLDWDKAHNHRRGVYKMYLPGEGLYIGGIHNSKLGGIKD